MSTKEDLQQNLELHNGDITSMFEYISSIDFLDLLTEISKTFIKNEKTKNKKEEIIGYWLTIQLRILIKKYFANKKITVQYKPRITGLLYNNIYELSIDLNGKTIIAITIKYIISNLSQNFQRSFDDVAINTININNYKGISYINLMIIPEEVPMFSSGQNKKFEKFEQLTAKHLIKLTNLSLFKVNQCYLPTIIVNKNVLISGSNLKSDVKQLKVKYAELSKIENIFIKNGYNTLVYQKIKDTILEDDIYTILKKILLLVKSKLSN